MISRRNFFKQSSIVAGGLMLSSAWSCAQDERTKTVGTISGPNATFGHRLRNLRSEKPKKKLSEDVVIIGGGVAGLSAARWLHKSGYSFRILELENEIGGNSRSGKNQISSYPLGAHYLPLPDLVNQELLSFLFDCNVITGYLNGQPIYNEYYLCSDPKERLYINNHWQEGLIPHEGVPVKDRDEIKRFLERMNYYRHLIGKDGKFAFAIPVKNSSQDRELLKLDTISMQRFLQLENFTSTYLKWYVNYCCADDFGSSITETSAWAGIHYFASRRASASNAKSYEVLTWPEGNHWLVDKLSKGYESKVISDSMAYRIAMEGDSVIVDCLDKHDETCRIKAKAVIIASPQFVNKHIIAEQRNVDYSQFQYAPWMVANMSLSKPFDEKRGESLCWDNVIFGSSALGYVNAAHQSLSLPKNENVVTYYKPLLGSDCASIRQQAQQSTLEMWSDAIIKDLQKAHPNVETSISQMDIWVWGHGMIRPSPGLIWSENIKAAARPISNKIFFAHSDVSGISIFEESFYRGLEAAQKVMQVV
jgi:monoamine oxidase